VPKADPRGIGAQILLFARIFVLLCVCLIPIASIASSDTPQKLRTIEDHIRDYYPSLVNKLETFGFKGPFGRELARYALIRQIHEDGVQRESSKSIVGLWPGCWNKEVIVSLTPYFEAQGLDLKTVGTPEGTKSYAIYGPMANIWSGVAIALVWEKYLDVLHMDPKLKKAWIDSKLLSERISQYIGPKPDLYESYLQLEADRRKVLETVNRMYNPHMAGNMNRTVSSCANAFEAALAASISGPQAKEPHPDYRN
jgi:hypothetical protein